MLLGVYDRLAEGVYGRLMVWFVGSRWFVRRSAVLPVLLPCSSRYYPIIALIDPSVLPLHLPGRCDLLNLDFSVSRLSLASLPLSVPGTSGRRLRVYLEE